MGRRAGLRALGRWAAIAGFAGAAAACSTIENMMPSFSEFRLPDSKTFVPTRATVYSRQLTATAPVGPADLVDGQGLCTGVAPAYGSSDAPPAAPPAIPARSVALEMTECEVARALGQPQQAEIGAEGATRTAVLTYTGGERPGIYRFVGGRLVAIERGAEPPPPPADAKKPPPKKPKPPPAPPA